MVKKEIRKDNYSGLKSLILSPDRYSLTGYLIRGHKGLGSDCESVDYESFFSPTVNRFIARFAGLPNRVKQRWMDPYMRQVNRKYRDMITHSRPDLVIVYNNQLLMPETIELIKQKSRLCFILGDHPLYTPTNIFNLHILLKADLVICPDTMWVEQLTAMGVPKVHFECFSWDSQQYFPFSPEKDILEKYGSDLVYVGSGHKNNWGYKRFLFLNLFADLDLKAFISGEGFTSRWAGFFPGLENRVIPHNRFDPAFNNMVFNSSKIAPIDAVPSLFRGIHIRMIEALGAGILPLCEYTSDLDLLFGGIDYPSIKNYGEAREMASWYIRNGKEREEAVRLMRNEIEKRYSPDAVAGRIFDTIFGENRAD